MTMTILCANCGKGEEESNHLKTCNGCKMVKYCNADCQKAHRPQHKKACKKRAAELFEVALFEIGKRAAELHDEALFKQPPQKEDCPICMLLLPSLNTGSKYLSCCGKVICGGCIYAVTKRDGGVGICPFCRTPTPRSEKLMNDRELKRAEIGDPKAMYDLGMTYLNGDCGFPQHCAKAVELWQRSGELGYSRAYFNVGCAYRTGRGVEVDEEKAKHYWELAAIGGDVDARFNLGVFDMRAGNMRKALNHYMIAVETGYGDALKGVKDFYAAGYATKDEYAKALRARQAYLDEIRSDQRDEAAAFACADYRYYQVCALVTACCMMRSNATPDEKLLLSTIQVI